MGVRIYGLQSRKGSSGQSYLSEFTKEEQGADSSVMSSPQTLTAIDLEADADAEYKLMLSSESSNTERIIPGIIPVCKRELDQDSAENFVLE